MTHEQLKANGWLETAHGNWRKAGRYPTTITPSIAQLMEPDKPKKRIRQSQKPIMNRLEIEALTWLGNLFPIEKIQCQAIRFRLGNGVTYTPDMVMLPDFSGRRIRAWEVKGKHSWDDAIVKIKMAATIYPEIEWLLVWKDDQGQWQKQQVLP